MREILTKTDLDELLENNENVFLKIGTSSCGPCKILGDSMNSVEPIYRNVVLAVVDASEVPEVVDEFGIRTVPSVLIKKGSDRVIRNGIILPAQIKEVLG